MHTFNGHSSDFYITQHGCSKGSPKVDADYFCRSFYGCAYTPTSYKVGSYSDSNRTGWQMHKNIGCSGGEGEEVDETDCDGAKCKIWETTKELQGLYNIVCVVSSGNDFFISKSIVYMLGNNATLSVNVAYNTRHLVYSN